MGMLNHSKNNNKSYHNKNLDHPAHINVEHELNLDDLDTNHHKSSVTTAVNIRVDNHIRNDISTLIQLGFAKSNKELVSKLVQNKVNLLSPEKKRRFVQLKQILEEKDVLNYKAKHTS